MEDMNPIYANAPVLIPKGNMSDNPGSYGGMMKAMNKAKQHKISAHSDTNSDFVTGYFSNSGVSYDGFDQSMTWPPENKK